MTRPAPIFDQQPKRPASVFLTVLLILTLAVTGLAVVQTTWAQAEGQDDAKPSAADDDKPDGDSPADSDPKDEPAVVDEEGQPIENPFPNRFPAPELDGGTAWLNTSGEITMKDLRGKIVLIDFWTYCCINCIHVLPDLKYLEHKFPNEVVVIGCHSAKFDNEKDTEAIRQAIVRYEIEHPVINDSEMVVWRKMGARAWPTLVLIDPEGNYCGYVSGEGNRELLEVVVKKLIAYHKAKGTLDQTPVKFDLESNKVPPGPLKYPGKLLADTAGKRLFISDSNHNRIVISSLDGKLIDIVGDGSIGSKDGSYSEASFDHPQGMALKGDTLYVADTENHLLRTVDLKAKTVSTLAGTGEQARFRARGGKLDTALNSPWDLEIVDDTLFIAMAGPHQIWSHKLGTDDIGVHSGSGREDIINGPHAEAALAQPSGIVSDGEFLYIADSEGSAIRKIAVDTEGDATTVVGAHDLPNGRSLFEFGDIDGVGSEARLQHPLGVALHGDGTLYVADAYNHKIKAVNLEKRESTTWIGDGTAGTKLEGSLRLHEPAGLALAGDTMYVADTNNHRIVTIDVKSKQATEFKVEGLTPPVKKTPAAAVSTVDDKDLLKAPAQKIAPGEAVTLTVKLRVPEGYKLNELFPLGARLTSADEQTVIPADSAGKRFRGKLAEGSAVFEIPLSPAGGSATFQLAVSYGYCRDGVGGLCKVHTARWKLPVEVAADGARQIELTSDLPK